MDWFLTGTLLLCVILVWKGFWWGWLFGIPAVPVLFFMAVKYEQYGLIALAVVITLLCSWHLVQGAYALVYTLKDRVSSEAIDMDALLERLRRPPNIP